MDVLELLKTVGDKSGTIISQGISYLAFDKPAKVAGILIFLIVGYFATKVANTAFKIALILAALILIAGLGVSLFA